MAQQSSCGAPSRGSFEYLKLDADGGARLGAAVEQALTDLGSARARMSDVHTRTSSDLTAPASVSARRDAWKHWQSEQRTAADHLQDALLPSPRHRLFAESRLKWLLRLDYGLRQAVGER